ncbi:hypothetical protein B5X24_HaOG211154 [Helicoverpa armigera]|nr:hypothetical protein B5X24_HaOG211154 [Helicoverpa armigera]
MLRHIIILLLSGCCLTIEILNLEEGADCEWNKVPGKCVNTYNCLSTFIDVRDKKFAPICSFAGKEPIICCTDCQFNNTRNVIFDNSLGFIHKGKQKAQNKCLEYIHRFDYTCKAGTSISLYRRLVKEKNCYEISASYSAASYGGVNAFRQQYPHMALLGYGPDVTTADWLCCGSVISEKFILTAGHCLSSSAVGEVKYIALGILKRTDPQELWQKYNVKRAIPHPEYKPPSKYHDIALLETDKTITFSRDVLPACLHSSGPPYNHLYATGWGALGHRRELADTLQAVNVSQYSEEECMKQYPVHRHLKHGYNHTIQMCYGDRDEPKDTCEGDSGGPLQADTKCAHTIVGVTSYGRQCGISAGSGIYTRVIYYVPWIESIVWP